MIESCSRDVEITLHRAGDGRIAGMVGAASALVAISGTWIPSLWGDEAASIMSARRDWSSLWALLGTVDAVHGLYYAFLHGWIRVAGDSPFAVRLPSGLAVGAASAGLYLLVRRRADHTIAIVAAVAFTVMPRVTHLATEARSLPLAIAAAVWLTLLMLRLLDRPARPVWWVAYSGGLAVGAYLFLYLVLLIPVHAIVVALERRRRVGPGIRPFALAWAVAVVLATPIGVVAAMQRAQIAFRARRDEVTAESLLVRPWFMFDWFALAGWGLVALAIAFAVVHRHDAAWQGRRRLLELSAAWMVVPPAVVLIATATITPLYTPRYLGISAPAVAIAMAVGVSALPGLWVRAVAIAAVVGLAVPAFVDQRTPYAKNSGTDWQTVSAVVAEITRPGDGIVFDEQVRPSRRPRLAMHAYPEGFRGLVDLALVRPYHETDGLWDLTAPLALVAERLDGVDRVVVVSRSEHGADDDVALLRREGFELVTRRMLASDEVAVYERAR